MVIVSSILKALNRGIFRNILRPLIFLGYKVHGKQIEHVKYHAQFRAWEFRIAGRTFLSTGPGWAYDYDYLYQQFKALSGNQYNHQPGDVVVDIGAGVGEETIVLSNLVGDKGKVFAIEAHPITYKALVYLVDTNRLSNVVTKNIAFSDKPGVVSIEDSDNSLANSIMTATGRNSFDVKAVTFDDFIEGQNIEAISFVKMNVEGAEQLIIKGMQRALPKIKCMAISCHDFRFKQGESEFFKTKQIVIDFLTANHFTVFMQQSKIDMVDDYVYAVNLRIKGFSSGV